MNQCAFLISNHFYFPPPPLMNPYSAFILKIDPRSWFATLANQNKYYEDHPKQLPKNIQHCRSELDSPLGEAFRLNSFHEMCSNAERFNWCYINCPYLHHVALKEAMDQMEEKDNEPLQTVFDEIIPKKDPGPIAPPPGVRIPYIQVEKPEGIQALNPAKDEIYEPKTAEEIEN